MVTLESLLKKACPGLEFTEPIFLDEQYLAFWKTVKTNPPTVRLTFISVEPHNYFNPTICSYKDLTYYVKLEQINSTRYYIKYTCL